MTPSEINHPPIDYRIIVAASVVLSIWLMLIDPVINWDAILYLRTAEAYLQEGLLTSFTLFDRPFLSILIGLLHRVSGLSLLHSGLLLSTVFYAILSTAFVSIVRLLGGDRRVQIIAAVIILSHPLLAQGRDSIMRDPPYWAFSLLAFHALLLYLQHPVFKYQLRWFAFIALATMFRFEGLFFVLLAPLAVFIASQQPDRLRIAIRLLALPAGVIVCLAMAVLLIQTPLLPNAHLFSDINGYIDKLRAFPQDFTALSAATGDALLVFTAKDDAGIATLAGLAAILFINLFRAVMWPYVLVLLWGQKNKLNKLIAHPSRSLLNSHLVIGLVYLGLFTLTNRLMLERYCHIFTIFVALYLPFIINAAWDPQRKPLLKYLAIFLLVGMSIDVVGNFNYKKMFIKDAAIWVATHTPADASVASNSNYIGYFSGREFNWENPAFANFTVDELSKRPILWRHNDYLVARVKPHEEQLWQAFLDKYSLLELKVFQGDTRGKISVVEIPSHFKIDN